MGIGPREPKCPTFCVQRFLWALASSMHRWSTCCGAHECLRVMGLERAENRGVTLSSSLCLESYKWKMIWIVQVLRKIDKKQQKLHTLECDTGCTSWICYNWTAGLTAVQWNCNLSQWIINPYLSILASIAKIYIKILSGHFPWLLKMLWGIISYSEVGKTMNYVAKVARDLIKARRESGHTEKVPLSGVYLHIEPSRVCSK